MITIALVAVVLALVAVLAARYGADSRTGDDPTRRDPAWPLASRRAHTPAGDARRAADWFAAHGRAWAAFDRSLRPWEQADPRPALEIVRPEDARCGDVTPCHQAPARRAS